MVMVVPVDAEVDETQNVSHNHGKQVPPRREGDQQKDLSYVIPFTSSPHSARACSSLRATHAGLASMLGPNGGNRQTGNDSDGHLNKSVQGDDHSGVSAADEHHNRQADAGVAVSRTINAEHGA